MGERLSFDILLLFSNFLSLSATREAILKCFYKNINILLKKRYLGILYLFTLFTVKVHITHIWKKDACVLQYTHIKILVTSRLLTLLLVAETETGRNGTANATHKVKNTLAYRFSGLSLELSCLAALPTVSSNQKNMLEDT